MDFNNENLAPAAPLQPLPEEPKPAPAEPTKEIKEKKRTGWKIFTAIILTLSVIANAFLVLMVAGLIAVLAAGRASIFREKVLQSGPRHSKIAIVRLEGIIESQLAEDIIEQLKTIESDGNIKAVIIRTFSPGGTVSASDEIHNQIIRLKTDANIPVIAFMQGIAASGAYYTSVACDKIVAEPTTITGSIGVVIEHFVLQQLLETKLGIQPVVIKSGQKKDWPSLFSETTEEQKQYIYDKLINPAYERFTQIVAEGRPMLSFADVKRLSDGSIYSAQEALDENLIDKIGYLDDAITLAKSMANLENAQVIEYQKPFSFSDFLTSQSKALHSLDITAIQQLSSPRMMYLWNAAW